MKTKTLLIGLLFSLAFQMNAQNVFDNLANEKDVTVVRLTKSAFQVIPDHGEINGIELGSLKDKLDLMEIFTSEKTEIINIMRSGIKDYKKNSNFEEIMMVKEEDSEIHFFVEKANKNSDACKSFIMFVDQGDEGVMMRLQGTFTLSDISNIIEAAM